MGEVRIGDRYTDESKMQKTNTNKEKAYVQLEYFSSICITETTELLPIIDRKEVPTLAPPTFTQERIRQGIGPFFYHSLSH